VVPLRGRVGEPILFCEAEQRFLLFSWKKKNTTNPIDFKKLNLIVHTTPFSFSFVYTASST
jgi:hypothetical protein